MHRTAERFKDGIQLLPIAGGKCGRMLVCRGESYLSRIWCVWEIFTLLVYRNNELALESMDYIILSNDTYQLPGSQSAASDATVIKCLPTILDVTSISMMHTAMTQIKSTSRDELFL